jgi:hypothetical protein
MSTIDGGPGGPTARRGVDVLSIHSPISAALGRRASELVLRFYDDYNEEYENDWQLHGLEILHVDCTFQSGWIVSPPHLSTFTTIGWKLMTVEFQITVKVQAMDMQATCWLIGKTTLFTYKVFFFTWNLFFVSLKYELQYTVPPKRYR